MQISRLTVGFNGSGSVCPGQAHDAPDAGVEDEKHEEQARLRVSAYRRERRRCVRLIQYLNYQSTTKEHNDRHPTIRRSRNWNIDDVDPVETQEWLDSIDSVLANEGPERARQLLDRVIDRLRRSGNWVPLEGTTSYVNTIPPELQECSPGDPAIEHRLQSAASRRPRARRRQGHSGTRGSLSRCGLERDQAPGPADGDSRSGRQGL